MAPIINRIGSMLMFLTSVIFWITFTCTHSVNVTSVYNTTRNISSNYTNNDDVNVVKLSFLASTSMAARYFAGAFFTALDDINSNASILDGYTLECLFSDTKGSSLNAINAMTSHYSNHTMGFIGPDVSCMVESTIAAAWNLPMIGYKCHDSKIGRAKFEERNAERDWENRRTFARTQPSTRKVSKSIISVLQYHQWKRLSIVVGGSPKWNETAESLIHLCKLNNIFVSKVSFFKEPYAFSPEMYNIVESTHAQTRIYVFLGDNHGRVDFVRLLNKIVGAESITDYVVITMDERLYTENPDHYIVKVPFENVESVHPNDIRSFENVLMLVPRPPLNYQWEKFLDDVRKRNEKPPINGLSARFGNFTIRVPIYAAYLHDAVTTYARALDAVLKSGGSLTNGTAIIDRIRNKTFTSILGYEVYVDNHGDAEGNYTLLTFSARDSPEIIPVGNFRMTQTGAGTPELNLFKEINWKNGKPPPDEPKCGFNGEKCIKEFNWQMATVCIVVAVVILIAGGFGIRHYLYEQKLARLLWKVDFKDIVLVDSVEEITQPTRKKRRRSKGHPWKFILPYETESERATLLGDQKRERSMCSEAGNKRYLIGSFKGTIVAVKHITKKNVEIDRDMKKQLQLRKELNHDNIARFLGACVETPHVYILTQYCQRGSLKDILENEDFSLDEMFISSLVSDLIKAMTFIHDSEIGTHGNLKSSNCLVDSRWVLMVSDFGLHKLVNERSGSITDIKTYYDNLLWKAPELLRNSNRDPAGTPKGDVYSFSIIIYEMFGRKGPWGETTLSSKEVVENIKMGNVSIPCRPDLSGITCDPYWSECMQECWAEDPEQRPDFKYIRFRLKPALQGIKSNIFDNMLAMMENYANDLEGLVEERTEQLSEEKKMTENLLLRMLPRTVADRLKKGEPVVPEHYDSVSIYFSDIVGFTELSAASTPLEVVCMLNDLYICFDAIVENYDVYKIETIGDAYFVVSGLPVRNGDLHAGEIASMALHMLRAIKTFKIKHRPDDTMKLRIGIHSGPCVAGVVGLKMPRYTLFGDTVNTASRMETTGVPLKIHCSSTITALLQGLGGYRLTERGYITAKGKGEMLTYFLEGENALHRQRRISHTRSSQSSSPNDDIASPAFGKATIHPKYWPNGTVATQFSTLSETETPEIHPNCDQSEIKDQKAVCDTTPFSMFTCLTPIPANNHLRNGTVRGDRTKSESNDCSTRFYSDCDSNNAPFTSLNSTFLWDKSLSSSVPVSLVENNNTSPDVEDVILSRENVPLIRNLETHRQMSLPCDVAEDAV